MSPATHRTAGLGVLQLVALPLLAVAEQLPEWPACKYSCDPPTAISPDSGNKETIWPPCAAPDGDCHSQCKDVERDCPRYAKAYNGYGCQDNPSFMLTQCPSSCNACHILDVKDRCVSIEAHPPALQPGDVDRMFNRLKTLDDVNVTVLSEDPWLVLVHNAVRDDEIELLRQERKWSRASDTGPIGKDGRQTQSFSSSRKTDVHWCGTGCDEEPATQRLYARISELTMVHGNHFERMQLLRYKQGMYYKEHHDSSGGSRRPYTGGRVYTAFIYLSDVDEGGETHFPKINNGTKVTPERGALLLWPSVQNTDPYTSDMRTMHAALPVISGQKFSANVWINQGPFTLAHNLGCAATPITRHDDEL